MLQNRAGLHKWLLNWNHQYVGQADSETTSLICTIPELLLFIFMVSNSFVRRGWKLPPGALFHLLNKAAVKLTRRKAIV